ncbi:MAG: 4Fe-4S dicluster domain-containing protein [Deferrisomatales bacterium]
MSTGSTVLPGYVCDVNEKRCRGCGECVSACTYGALELIETPQGSKVAVKEVRCEGDGLCNAVCATGAISLREHTNEDIFRQIDAIAGY